MLNTKPTNTYNYPKATELAKLTKTAGEAGSKELRELKDKVFELFDLVAKGIESTENEIGYVLDPEQEYVRVEKLSIAIGGLRGLVTASRRRAWYLYYQELTEASKDPDAAKGKLKLSQGDREQYARGLCGDLEGIESSLDSWGKNVESRMYALRGSVRLGRH